jgi:hypothetical protein
MINIYNTISKELAEKGLDNFNCTLFNVEYRKNKSVKDLSKLVDTVNAKCKYQEDKITVLSLSIKNIFKEIKNRKVTIIKKDDNGNIKTQYSRTTLTADTIKKNDKDVISVLSGHCRVEK